MFQDYRPAEPEASAKATTAAELAGLCGDFGVAFADASGSADLQLILKRDLSTTPLSRGHHT